ncbi:MAG: Ig-like domain-containing protein [Verrucomicrobia bacterium]|nr:Ig-like domain-containing protein [Verrucomicrobiota bacterium]
MSRPSAIRIATRRAMIALIRCALVVAALAAGPTRVRADGPGIGNLTYASNELFSTIARFTSTNGSPRGQGFVAMHKGYLVIICSDDNGGGNGSGGFSFYNVANPRVPVLTFSTFTNALYSNSGSSNYAGDIREAHAFSFFSNYVCMPANKNGGSGLLFWDWSRVDPPNIAPLKVGSLVLPGLTGGDYAPTPWWVFWQGGRYVYVAGTSGGIYIVDASNPAQPVLVNRGVGKPNPIPNSQTGGFRINTIFAVGNLLVCAGSDVDGITTFDISDPANPVLLQTLAQPVGYSMMVNGNRILGANDPARIWDISNPSNITLVGIGPDVADKGGYGTFQDGIFHYGSSSAYVKLRISSLPFTVLGTVSPSGFNGPDWDFATPLGNLIFMGNDHSGSALIVHQTGPDTNGPAVNMVVPKDGATNQALTTRVGLTFTDMLDLRTINTNTCIVRPAGGSALPGRYSLQTGIVNFWPDTPLLSDATYEVVVPAGGIKDYVGNLNSLSFTSRFSTAFSTSAVHCAASAAPPAPVGQSVTFNASATGGAPIQFSWNFGDGTPATAFTTSNTVTHSYAQPGHYPVSVIANNGTSQAGAQFVQTIHRPLTLVQPTASGTIILDAPAGRVWCVNPDHDTVTAIHATNFTRLFEKPAGKNPRTLAPAPDGTVWVVNQRDATISVLDRNTGDPAQPAIVLPRGSRPYGIAFAPDGTAAYVTLQGTGRLLRLDSVTRAISGNLDVGPTPRGIAISGDSQRILVTRFISPDAQGEVVEVSAATFTVARTFGLAIDTTPDREDAGRGLPNYLSSITISPDGQRAWVPSKKDNIQRGTFRDGRPLTFESTVRTIVSQIDLGTNAEVITARVDLNDRDLAFAARFSLLGDYAFVAVQGGNSVDVFDAYNGARVTALENIGRSPQGLVLSADGRRLFVQNFMSRTVSVHDIGGIVASTNNLAALLATVAVSTNEPLAPQVFLGKQIFYNAKDSRMNRDNYISCAVCHLDGGHDGRVWDFTDRGEGLRNTITLLGRAGMGQGRVHWSGNFDEIQDFEHDMRGPFAGSGFMSDALFNSGGRNTPLGGRKAGFSPELDALAAYVASLTNVNASPFRGTNGSLTADGEAGKVIFATLNCASCHSGNNFTDSSAGVLHDVGTLQPGSGQRLGQLLTGIDTPTLKGVWETAPYLHNGSAPTLADVFSNPTNTHGALTDSLGATELAQFVSYLLQIDDSEIVNVPPTVSLDSPANGVTFVLPTALALSASADSSNGIRQVEFFADGVPLAVASNAPFSFAWTDAAAGSYVLVARATDNLGDFTDSAAALITVALSALSPLPVTVSVGEEDVRSVSFATVPGRTYTVEFTDSLQPSVWLPLETVTADTSLTSIVDVTPNVARFYRVRAE